MTRDEGYIKFHCEWEKKNPLPEGETAELIACRQKLYNMGLIGMYEDGIGFGNVSVLRKDGCFAITGSGTGGKRKLSGEDISLVTRTVIDENRLYCEGPVRASSESMTHDAVYRSSPETTAVIHIHSHKIWDALLNKVPTTPPEVLYGTPEMAYSIMRLMKEGPLSEEKVLVMAGHPEGVLSFGKNLDEAFDRLLQMTKDLVL